MLINDQMTSFLTLHIDKDSFLIMISITLCYFSPLLQPVIYDFSVIKVVQRPTTQKTPLSDDCWTSMMNDRTCIYYRTTTDEDHKPWRKYLLTV